MAGSKKNKNRGYYLKLIDYYTVGLFYRKKLVKIWLGKVSLEEYYKLIGN